MAKKSRKRKSQRPRSLAKHTYHHGQQANQWLVPLTDGHACIYHGHESSDDHSMCGPQLFCCHKAATQFLQQYPATLPANISLQPMLPADLLAWLSPNGPSTFYFYFCDPVNRQRVYFQGFSKPLLCPILTFEKPLFDLVVNSIVVV